MALLTGWGAAVAQQLTPDAPAAVAVAGTASKQAVDQVVEDEKINQLINYLRHLPNAIFIRNGSEFSPEKAADHLQGKWEKHKNKIKTAHDFVEKLATVSKTKEPYQIRFSDGRTLTCNEVLNKELSRMESAAPVAGSPEKN